MVDEANADEQPEPELTMRAFRESFYYGSHSDMNLKFLRKLSDDDAADVIAGLLSDLGQAFDTGDLGPARERLRQGQITAQAKPLEPQFDDAPFTPFTGELADARLLLVTAGGVFRRDDDPMGPDGPTQDEILPRIKEFLAGKPTLTSIPVDTTDDELTARHPGYDAVTPQRDPCTVFPLSVLRDLADEGRVTLADTHYSFVGATSHLRLQKQIAPQWAERFVAEEVDVCLLVAT